MRVLTLLKDRLAGERGERNNVRGADALDQHGESGVWSEKKKKGYKKGVRRDKRRSRGPISATDRDTSCYIPLFASSASSFHLPTCKHTKGDSKKKDAVPRHDNAYHHVNGHGDICTDRDSGRRRRRR